MKNTKFKKEIGYIVRETMDLLEGEDIPGSFGEAVFRGTRNLNDKDSEVVYEEALKEILKQFETMLREG